MEDRLRVLDVQNSWEEQNNILSGFVKEHFKNRDGRLNILEAGCGRSWNLDLEGLDYVLTGVDISEEVLEGRKNQQRDLDQAILADLESLELEASYYDLIYCSYVLEHVRRAEHVVDKFFTWLKPNGLLVLLIPDRDTFRCLMSRATPHWFHVFFYRRILKRRDAGKPGNAPFRAYYHKLVSRKGILEYCRRNGYAVHIEYGKKDGMAGKLDKAVALPIAFLGKLVELISFGKISSRHCDLIYVIEKKSAVPQEAAHRYG